MNKKEAIKCLDLIHGLKYRQDIIQAFAKTIGLDPNWSYQQLRAHLDGVDLTPYADENVLQLEQRHLAGKHASLLNGDHQQMRQQRFALEAGLDVTLLSGTWRQMDEQRLALEDGLDATLLHGTWKQMKEQRLALQAGLDATLLHGSYLQMNEQRIKMLEVRGE